MAANVKLISQKHADKIVDDLLKKYPQGPKLRLSKDHYTLSESWDWRRRRYIRTVVLDEETPEWRCHETNLKSFGYGDGMLSMVIHYIEKAGGMRSYLRGRDRDCGEAAITRRANRLEKRISTAHARFTSADGRGIYRVRSNGINIYVISNSTTTAKLLGKTMLATSGINLEDAIYSTKVSVASVELLKKYNDDSYKQALQRVQRLHKQIERQKAEVIAMNHLAESIMDFGNIQPDMLSD